MTQPISRRRFVAGSSATAIGLGLGPGIVKAQRGSASSSRNDVIRAATIGVRGKGGHHMTGLEAVNGCEMTALCDIDESVLNNRADLLEKRTGRKIKRFADYRDLVGFWGCGRTV